MMKELVRARRQFFRSLLRNGSLALLGVAGGVGVTKRRRLVREGKCVGGGVCSGCGVFDECGLPRALSAKLAAERTHDGR
jgi:hypothetical protein